MSDTTKTTRRTGILFRPGDYGAVFTQADIAAGKKGVYTEADMDAMASDTPIPIRMSHHPTLLDGKLGKCTRRFVGFDNGGKVLMGEWEEPEPLSLLLGDTRRGASIEVDPLTKHVAAVALEIQPHIIDAAFFSRAVEDAYVKFSKGESVQPLSTFAYESSTERDAIPPEDFGDPANKLFPVRTQDELRQSMRELAYADDPTAVKVKILEIATRKGLQTTDCEWPYWQTRGVSKPLDAGGIAMYSAQEKVIMPNEKVVAPAAIPAPEPTLTEKLKARFSAASADELEQVQQVLTQAKTGKTPREIELEAQLATFATEKETSRLDGLHATAEAAANALIDAKHILPADKETVVAAFSAAAEIDAKLTTLACFSKTAAPAEFSMTKHLNELYSKLPAHDKTDEKTTEVNPDYVAIFEQGKTTVSNGEGKPVPLSRIEELMSATSLGRAVNASANGATGGK